nr:protein QUIRKY-like isoform X2 [Physcomitrium patens]|eukprot:XP_024367664.1 protein QUIRKY-like isoform X2 [Physcomitrella patens]
MVRKLIVEVVAAKALMPKDGQGSTNAYCVLDYDGQRKRTRVKSKDLDPTWNEKFEFLIRDVAIPGDLEINIQNERNSGTGRRSSFLGKVTVPIQFVPNKPEPVRWYPLQKRGLFSHIKGDLGLRIWWQPAESITKSMADEMSNRGRVRQDLMEGGGGRANNNVAKADRQPYPIRPNPGIVPETDFIVKETNPDLGKAVDYNQHFNLVEQMGYLFVRVVRARDLLGNGRCDPYCRVFVGPVKAETRIVMGDSNPEWNQVFAIGKDKIQGGAIELSVCNADDFLGGFMVDLHEVPLRRPPEAPLSPQWYKLEAKTGKGSARGEIMVSIWWGTQADEAFPEAWHSDTGGQAQFRQKVYLSPKLWYLRCNVIEAQELASFDHRLSKPFVRVQVGPYQTLQTRPSFVRTGNPFWNEDLMFVASEPFEDILHLVVLDQVGSQNDILGQARIPLNSIERRIDGHPVVSRWYVLEREGGKGVAFLDRIHLRLCFDGGYHVMDESPNYISDTRPTARQLWKHPLGVLELGIHGANSLLPMKTTKDHRGSTDAYCVAKYGPKWIRTRTIFDSFNPRWQEQYTWEVHDPCTVLTVGVFDNRHAVAPGGMSKDLPIGKVRIRLSTLESDRVYTNAYPLLVVTPQGVKKMGELELAVRFSCASTVNLMHAYLQPQLPKMHYFYPLDPRQEEALRVAAMNIVALRLMRSDPPLRQEVVQFMLDTEAERWCMRRSKANYYRILGVLNGPLAVMNWFTDICSWKSPVTTILVHILYLILVWYPELFLPTVCLYMFLIGSWNYRFRSRTPPFMDAKLSQGEYVGDYDELEEEFNVVPAQRAQEVLKYRYERLRGVAGRIQNALGDLASMGEKFHSLLSWRDPRASAVFIAVCLISAIVLYVTPFQVVAILWGVYALRHPRFRDPLPSVPLNLLKRLPSQADRIL